MAGREHEEKRQFQRMQLESQLQFRREGETTLFKAKTLDLSASGVRFTTTESLLSDELLQIVIHSQHPQISPLVAEGKVKRVESVSEEEQQFIVSVVFSNLS